MAKEFDKHSLSLFAAVLICLENSFWSLSNPVTFSNSFQKAFKLYTESGIREKLETSLKSLGDYPPLYSDTIVAFRSLLLETLLKHRLPHSDNSHPQSTH
ncbi:hypothetical protein GALMADRAFT_1124604 [Galerina marginata CBS 339.88]|uniref:Uncharacterized protein n=1 Tax=Galerina marginata (strain CBS 339.88) TaxID=685588 RepID=A0A067TFW0_GALM3|nr:hypothetical protein GALMADRAFT_1124604 [Galerina marginata CBS 339.88]